MPSMPLIQTFKNAVKIYLKTPLTTAPSHLGEYGTQLQMSQCFSLNAASVVVFLMWKFVGRDEQRRTVDHRTFEQLYLTLLREV